MTPLFAVLALLIFVVIFGCALLWVASLFGPKPPADPVKLSAYECGLPEQSPGHTKIPVKFYLTAILFILFDIEIIFMYPWAITFGDFLTDGAGLYLFGVMGFFILIFIYGLIWEIKSRALEWE